MAPESTASRHTTRTRHYAIQPNFLGSIEVKTDRGSVVTCKGPDGRSHIPTRPRHGCSSASRPKGYSSVGYVIKQETFLLSWWCVHANLLRPGDASDLLAGQ